MTRNDKAPWHRPSLGLVLVWLLAVPVIALCLVSIFGVLQ